MLTHHVETSNAYTAHRDQGNPHTWITIMESMY